MQALSDELALRLREYEQENPSNGSAVRCTLPYSSFSSTEDCGYDFTGRMISRACGPSLFRLASFVQHEMGWPAHVVHQTLRPGKRSARWNTAPPQACIDYDSTPFDILSYPIAGKGLSHATYIALGGDGFHLQCVLRQSVTQAAQALATSSLDLGVSMRLTLASPTFG